MRETSTTRESNASDSDACWQSRIEDPALPKP